MGIKLHNIELLSSVEKKIFHLLPERIGEYVESGHRWKKSNYVTTIRSKEGILLYNTLLNSPMIANEMAQQYFDALSEFAFPTDPCSEEEECQFSFAESLLFLPINVSEEDIISVQSNDYLRKFSRGVLFDTIDIRVSESCNFGCAHCIAGKSKRDTLMTFGQAKNIIDYIVSMKVNSNQNNLKLHYGNAEPIINVKIIQQIHDYIESVYPFIVLQESLNTNLSLINENLVNWFKENKIQVYASLDGNKDGNDKIRVLKNGQGTYDIILDKLYLFEKTGYPLKGISVTITDDNYDYVKDDFIDWCIKQDFTSVAYDFDLINMVNISIEEAADFLVSTWRKFRNAGVEFYGTWATLFLNISNNSYLSEVYGFCSAKIGRNLSINSDGVVYPCAFSSIPVCDLKNLGEAITPHNSFYTFVKSNLLKMNSTCFQEKCRYVGACVGQCEVTKEYGEEKAKHQCEFYRKVTDKMLLAQLQYEDF